jgi:hypothetical protein
MLAADTQDEGVIIMEGVWIFVGTVVIAVAALIIAKRRQSSRGSNATFGSADRSEPPETHPRGV